jgi:hypothetical protein
MHLLIIASSTLIISFASGSEELPYCNWAQKYASNLEKLLNDESKQDAVMMLAAEWEGKFAKSNIDDKFDNALTTWGYIDFTSGELKEMVGLDSYLTSCAFTSIIHFKSHLC